VTVTALAGTVVQELKSVPDELTVRVHAPPLGVPVFHVTTAAADPLTTGVPVGLVAVKVIVAGVTVSPEIVVVASGFGLTTAGATCAGAALGADTSPPNNPDSSSVTSMRRVAL